MPTPMTTGALKTKVSEMQVGDYIACSYNAPTSGNVGTFSDLGTATGVEIPVAGSATPNGIFYFIKVNKAGILVADRVVQNMLSWDKLNQSKLIQGLPWDNGNIIPPMTSNTSPSGVASASSEFSAAQEAWQAFDGIKGTNSGQWLSGLGMTQWIQYQFNKPKNVKMIAITATATAQFNRTPTSFTFEASNTGEFAGEQVILLSVENGDNYAGKERKTFSFPNRELYTHYRLVMTGKQSAPLTSGYEYVISELEMFDTVGTIRSLTGGVAYADENKNKSLTDKGLGTWPIHNEWDNYILHYPHHLIQPNKTLDDVFHVLNIGTWTQDTPILDVTGFGAVNSSYRIYRGYYSEKTIGVNPSSYAGELQGFRPVFQYKEQ